MFTIQSVKNIVWASPDHEHFMCMVKFEEFDEELPFGCLSSDPLPHVQELWTRVTSGEFGPIAEYSEPELPPADQPQPEVSGAQTL